MEFPFLLSEAQMRRIELFFPLRHGVRIGRVAVVYGLRHRLQSTAAS